MAGEARSVDHLVLPVGRLDVTRARLTKLGFTVAPDARHPFGTANVCVFLGDDTYLEMLAVDRRPLYEKAVARDNSFVKRDWAWRFRNGEEGFAAIAFKTDDARADHAEFRRQGLSGGRMVAFSRFFAGEGGKREKGSFRLAFAADLRAPDAFFFCCQRVAYPAADRSHLTAHENGVTALRGIVMASDRPQDFAAALQDVFHAPARAESTLAINARNADIEVTPREKFTARFGWKPAMHGPGLMLGGVVFRTSSLEALERLFARNGVAFEKRGGRLIVAPAEGQGTLFLFEGSQT